MRFIDEATIEATAGDGGNGCISFLHLPHHAKGGPNGGAGGRGGNVVLRATTRTTTLADHSYLRHFRAKRGTHGLGSDKNGRAGADKLVRVPVGTIVRDLDTDEILADMVRDEQEVVVARGGRGGKGNKHFTTSTNRAPRMAQDGEPGEKRNLRLELKLLAQVGLIGLPNAGKSSLITAASSAKPKVADYPFTTLTPQLGVVQVQEYEPFTMADIPGLVEGAHAGAGLGLRFLKHVERTQHFVYVVDLSGEDPLNDLATVQAELLAFSSKLAEHTAVVAANKIDLADSQDILPIFQQEMQEQGLTVYPISALTGQGVPALMEYLAEQLQPEEFVG